MARYRILIALHFAHWLAAICNALRTTAIGAIVLRTNRGAMRLFALHTATLEVQALAPRLTLGGLTRGSAHLVALL